MSAMYPQLYAANIQAAITPVLQNPQKKLRG